MPKRQDWQAQKAATAKALRDWPRCSTDGCEGKALGILLGYDLCVTCQIKRLRAQRERVCKSDF